MRRIKITTAAPASATLEGSLFTACPITNVVAIDIRSQVNGVASNSDSGDYRIIPFARIQSFQIVSLASNGTSSTTSLPVLGSIDTVRAQDRLEARINKLKEEEANRGKGVTRQAQAIFDALKRVYVWRSIRGGSALTCPSNIPIRWHDQQMVAHEAVIISPPYRPEDCKGGKDKQQVLNQVRRVLEGETKKLKDREDRERKTATPPAGGQRKGG